MSGKDDVVYKNYKSDTEISYNDNLNGDVVNTESYYDVSNNNTAEDILYKLWLNIVCGHNPKVIFKCLNTCGSAEEMFESETAYNKMLKCLPLGLKLKVRRSLESAKELLKECDEKGIKVISIDDMRYPKRLAQVYMPPQILYVKGDLPDIDSLVCITMVGSRNCTDGGREFANNLAYDLAREGVLIVGGMAEGIDTAAHIGACMAGGKTVAVLAGGPDIIYPKSGKDVYDEICTCGAVISERPPGTIGKGYFYKERNRIMVGLSQGTIITEGEEHSGTKLTATWTIDSNRDLFAVPGRPDDKFSALPNSLIKDSAKLILSYEDIIEEYETVYSEHLELGKSLLDEARANKFSENGFEYAVPKSKSSKVSKSRAKRNQEKNNQNQKNKEQITEKLKPIKPDFSAYSEKQRIILEYLHNNNEPMHIDDISLSCNIDMSELSFLLIQLEMTAAIQQSAGNYYCLK